MALATQCPHCLTTFRVANDQLKLRAGLVRCGSCREVFNGIEHLIRPESTAGVEMAVAKDAAHPTASVTAVTPQPPQASSAPSFTEVRRVVSPDATQNEVQHLTENDVAEPLAAQAGVVPAPTNEEIAAEAKKAALVAELDAAASAESIAADSAVTPIKPHEPQVWHRLGADAETPPSVATTSAENDEVIKVDDDPLQRMTLFQVATQHRPDDSENQTQEKYAKSASEEDEELDRLIDELQNRPWPQSQKSEKSDTEKSSAALSATQNDAPNAIYGDVRHDYRMEARRNDKAEKNLDKKLEKAAAEEPEFIQQAKRKQRFGGKVRTAIWVGSALLFFAAIVQTGFTFRDQLAARVPTLKPVLEKMCAPFDCKIALPMKIDAISIESNELQALSTGSNSSGNQFALNLLMRNTGSTVLAWPNVELTLKDVNDKPQVRRVFTPHDYLPAAINTSQGFARNTEQSVKLAFELHQLKASGYSVYLFYP
ncbi:DUF3426 domain-containing protein [Glaciimonas soli]|uniref:DUF3426 domain-containing protein n=1 Tax=Glaciimonas soli TaxID=2590999 RepID=A0A843YQK3_9BURK|nr:DUF3426 domain-containing protein [Glaciimonas soli]MQR01360.1 DUF3426 domain-containing protein [Glaciimonas soli]